MKVSIFKYQYVFSFIQAERIQVKIKKADQKGQPNERLKAL